MSRKNLSSFIRFTTSNDFLKASGKVLWGVESVGWKVATSLVRLAELPVSGVVCEHWLDYCLAAYVVGIITKRQTF